jgi:ATP-binding cassette subfamily B protein
MAASGSFGTLTNVAQQLLQERMTLTIRHQVMDHASRLDLAFFEGSESYDLLRQASLEAPARPVSMMNSALSLVRAAVTFASMIVLLVSVSPLLAGVVLVAPIPAFISQSKYGARAFMLALYVSPVRRQGSGKRAACRHFGPTCRTRPVGVVRISGHGW